MAETLIPTSLEVVFQATDSGLYQGSEEERATLTEETDDARKKLKAAAVQDEKATDLYKAIALLVLHFCVRVIRPGTVAGFTIEGPDWSRESDVCKRYSNYLITGALSEAKVSDATRTRVGGNIRAHIDSWAREQVVKEYVATLHPDLAPDSEAFASAVETQYARFGLKLPGTTKTRGGGSGGGSGKGSENPVTTLASVSATTAVSDKIGAADKITAAHRLVDGVISSLISRKGAIEGRPEFLAALEGLYLAVSTLHERETDENTSTDYSALASVMLAPPKATEETTPEPEETPEEETPEETPKAKAKATA